MLFALKNSISLTLKNADGSLQGNKSVNLTEPNSHTQFTVSFDESATATTEELPYAEYTVQYGTGTLNSKVEVNESAVSQTIYTNEIMISYSIKVRVHSKDTALPLSGVSVGVFLQN